MMDDNEIIKKINELETKIKKLENDLASQQKFINEIQEYRKTFERKVIDKVEENKKIAAKHRNEMMNEMMNEIDKSENRANKIISNLKLMEKSLPMLCKVADDINNLQSAIDKLLFVIDKSEPLMTQLNKELPPYINELLPLINELDPILKDINSENKEIKFKIKKWDPMLKDIKFGHKELEEKINELGNIIKQWDLKINTPGSGLTKDKILFFFDFATKAAELGKIIFSTYSHLYKT